MRNSSMSKGACKRGSMSKVREEVQLLQREFVCAVCLCTLDDPQSLPCNHQYCRGCITQVLKTQGKCPLCKVQFSRRAVKPNPHLSRVIQIYHRLADKIESVPLPPLPDPPRRAATPAEQALAAALRKEQQRQRDQAAAAGPRHDKENVAAQDGEQRASKRRRGSVRALAPRDGVDAPVRAFRRGTWSTADLEQLHHLHQDGVPVDSIALQLRRSAAAVQRRIDSHLADQALETAVATDPRRNPTVESVAGGSVCGGGGDGSGDGSGGDGDDDGRASDDGTCSAVAGTHVAQRNVGMDDAAAGRVNGNRGDDEGIAAALARDGRDAQLDRAAPLTSDAAMTELAVLTRVMELRPPTKQFVIVATAMDIGRLRELKEATTRLGGRFVRSFSDAVTHVVTLTSAGGEARRTFKMMCGVAAGRWVVDHSWVQASIAAGKWLEESAFEVQGDCSGRGAARRSRLALVTGAPRVLTSYSIHLFSEQYQPPSPSRQELEALARLAGARVSRRLVPVSDAAVDSSRRYLVLCDPASSPDQLAALYLQTGHRGVSSLWLMESISCFAAADLARFQWSGSVS